MDVNQYELWKDFSMRMATRVIRRREKLRQQVIDAVEDFFGTLESDYFQINEVLPVAWDEKWRMDMNNNMRQLEFLRDRVKSWDHTDRHPTWKDRYGHSTNGPYICDIVSTLEVDHWNPHASSWSIEELDELEDSGFDLDEQKRIKSRCLADHHWTETVGADIRCCLRAGLDCACEPSMGVMGFTAGDIRRMYPEGVPEWVFPKDENLEVHHWKGVIPGVGLVPGEVTVNGTFASLPDDAEVWL